MKSTKCVVCAKVKGKRLCKLQAGTFICSRCCGQIRHAECEGCSYYAQAEQYALKKAPKSNRNPFIIHLDPEVNEEVDQALAMIEQGREFVGETILSAMLKSHSDLPTVQFAMGTARTMQKRYDEALPYFDRAIEIAPDFAEAWFNKGMAHKEELDVGETIRAMQKVLDLGHPADEFVQQANRLVANLEQQIRDNEGLSLDEYLRAQDLFEQAFALMETGQWRPALEGFQAVIALNPTNTQSYGNLGICYAYLGQKQDALTALDKALELDPHYGPARLNREAVAALAEGEKLPENSFGSVDYYKEVILRNR